jgi:hypothetical protein
MMPVPAQPLGGTAVAMAMPSCFYPERAMVQGGTIMQVTTKSKAGISGSNHHSLFQRIVVPVTMKTRSELRQCPHSVLLNDIRNSWILQAKRCVNRLAEKA